MRRSDPPSALGQLVLVAAFVLYGLIGRESGTGPIKSFYALIEGYRLVMERVTYEASFGAMARMYLIETGRWWVMHVAAAILIAVLVAALWPRLRGNPDFRRMAMKTAYIVVAFGVISALMRNVQLEIAWGRRYSYMQSIPFAVLLLVAITDTLVRLYAAERKLLAAAAGLAVGAWLIVLNVVNNHLYRTQVHEWPRLRALLDQVDEAERANSTAVFRVERDRFPIVVRTRAR